MSEGYVEDIELTNGETLVVDKVCCEEEEEEEEEEEKIIRLLLLLLLLLWLNVQEYKTEKETLNEYSIKTAYGIENNINQLYLKNVEIDCCKQWE
ncbi:hypothetical protein T4B_1621 [Trichinella pseudospiralis]|uniref:Uncharacterized protein n=1 Tax=Trichinella pseudospiralis TaxID=6337 RepID=A0A0V1J481_TRIPS|nr:hypothetical protein T4A_9251 [Trichinella pseudospiralis]KRZ29461.1 hypothetical protein T4B_1621 [Trichinella pseudospiralis]